MARFSVSHISAMGQGVAKEGKAVTFIAKTLPDEEVEASVYKKKKQIAFARLDDVITPSSMRQKPECEHFNHCAACHYLHTSYEQELTFKKQALLNYFNGIAFDETKLSIISSGQRMQYRNRVQLHYRHKYLGFINPETDQVVEVPNCKIIRPELQQSFDALYADKAWAKQHEGRGHVELYLKNDEVKQSWNSDYASGGFTQVNETINEKMVALLAQELERVAPESLIDCFSGTGNLSNSYAENTASLVRKMLDVNAQNKHEDFILMNLYDADALTRFVNRTKIKRVDCLLVDPPRKGFPKLNDWLTKLKLKHLLYVSCDPATLARDLKSLTRRFEVEALYLLDMFPGTYHFETFVSLRLKK